MVSKLFIATSAIVALISGFIYLYFPVRIERNAQQDLERRAQTIAKMLAYTASPALVFEDTTSAQEALGAVIQAPDVEFLLLLDGKRQLFAGYQAERGKELLNIYGQEANGFTGDQSFYLHSEPILHQEKEIGKLTVGFTLAEMKEAVSKMRTWITIVALSVLILGMAVAYWLTRFIMRPLSGIVKVINDVGEGNMQQRATVDSDDEVGDLARNFNLMLDKLAQSTAELQLRETRFRKLAETMNEGLLQWQPNGTVLFANETFCAMFGFDTPKEVVNSDVVSLFGADSGEVLKGLQAKVQEEGVQHEEQEFISVRGQAVDILLSIAPEWNKEGVLVRINGLFTNISRLKATEQELRYKNRELDTFVYRASHDLKSPLQSMQGLVKMALGETEDPKSLPFLQMILKSTEKMYDSLLELMEVARTREGKANMVELDLGEMIQDTLASLGHMKGYDQISITTNVGIGQKVKGDRALLGSALQNLISNAVKYHRPQGDGRFVRIDFEKSEGYCRIAVTDNGPGIAEGDQLKLFDMFYRANASVEGTGLGLYIVKTGIEKMGGTIRVKSKVGEGTTFMIEMAQKGQYANG